MSSLTFYRAFSVALSELIHMLLDMYHQLVLHLLTGYYAFWRYALSRLISPTMHINQHSHCKESVNVYQVKCYIAVLNAYRFLLILISIAFKDFIPY